MPGFSRDLRIRKRRDYLRVQQSGTRVRVKGRRDLLILVAAGSHPQSRYGITVSRKVGNAVTRNRVKRWLREAIRHEHSRLQGLPAVDVVFIARSSSAHAGAQKLQQQVRSAFQSMVKKQQRQDTGTVPCA